MNRYEEAVRAVRHVVSDENTAIAVVDHLIADRVIPIDIDELLDWWGALPPSAWWGPQRAAPE